MKKILVYVALIIMALGGSACGSQLGKPVEAAVLPKTMVESRQPTPAPIVEQHNITQEDMLLWEGPALFAEDQTECHRLRLTQDYQAFLGPCAGEPTEVAFVPNQNGGLADMITRFAPFQADLPQGRLTFNGQGQLAGPAWERALTSWAQFTDAELASGRVGAANRTALAWHLGEQDGQCQMLLVLSHGYATAGRSPCEGGQMEVIASNWVDTTDWEQFDSWLYNRAPLYQNNSYLDGRGSIEMSAEEATALARWAESMYAKLTQTGSNDGKSSTQAAAPPADCPVPNANQQLLLSQENGYCLLYPAEYSLAQPIPSSIEIVKDTVMNHIDPRLSIQVEDAAGRSLEDVARQMEADYVPPGFTVERGAVTVDEVEAVMLDNLPGQDLNRRVAFIQNGRLYHLFFAPLGEEGSEVRRQAELLYQQVMDSFRFLQTTIPTPIPEPSD